MILNVVSWNTQGSAVAKIIPAQKYLFVDKAIGADGKIDDAKNIILIQEAGTANIPTAGAIKFGRRNFLGYFAEQEGAINKRCTTGIFAEEELIDPRVTQFGTIAVKRPAQSPDSKTSKEPRPVVKMQLSVGAYSFILATVHATAYMPIARGEIKYIMDTLDAEKMDWILMGDFNCPPSMLASEGVAVNRMAVTEEHTHIKGHWLDYAVFSKDFIDRIKVKRGLPGYPDYLPADSDHYPVYFQLEL